MIWRNPPPPRQAKPPTHSKPKKNSSSLHVNTVFRSGLCFDLRGGGGGGTRPWWLALLACGGAYWPLAFEPSAMTGRHPYYCGGGGGQGPA